MASIDTNKKQLVINRMSQATFDSLATKNDNEIYIVEDANNEASSSNAGVMKLYSTTGQNTDGTMTQKAITDSIASSIIPAGTIYEIPTDFESLEEFFNFLEGKTSSGMIKVKFVDNTYTETQWLELPNCNIPSIIIDGNNSTFKKMSNVYVSSGLITFDSDYSAPDGDNFTHVIIENVNFVNESADIIPAIYMQGNAFSLVVRNCTFTNFLSDTGSVYFAKSTHPCSVSNCTFTLDSNSTINASNEEISFICARASSNIFCIDNEFVISVNNTNSTVTSMIRATKCSKVSCYQNNMQVSSNSEVYLKADKSSIVQATDINKTINLGTLVDVSSDSTILVSDIVDYF